VATALNICESMKKSSYLDIRIRVDYRQPTSYSVSSSRIDGLASLIDYVKSQKSSSNSSEYDYAIIEAIDRQWLEQVIYNYEEDVQITTPSPANRFSHIVRPHKHEDSCAAIIILGEADYCIPFMGAPPFPPFKPGRMPQETELYRSIQGYDRVLPSANWQWQRHYIGTHSRNIPLTKKRPAPVMLENGADGHESEPRSKRSATSKSSQVSSLN